MRTQVDGVPGHTHWSPDNWAAFWSAPDPEVAKTRVPLIVRDDVTAHWPSGAPCLRGKQQYVEAVLIALELAPDLRLKREDWATNGEVTFIRWSGRGTGKDGRPFECQGVDCIRLRDGLVIENRILSDSPYFVQLARVLSERFAPASTEPTVSAT